VAEEKDGGMMAIVTQTFAEPVIALMLKSGLGDPQVIEGDNTLTYDDSLYEVVSAETVASALKGLMQRAPDPPPVLSELELLRLQRLKQLNDWWDQHPGILIDPGIDDSGVYLPIQEEPRTVNRAEYIAWIANGADEELAVVSADDLTYVIQPGDVNRVFNSFLAGFSPLSSHWDSVITAIRNATTILELNSIQIYP
jgi:hypothetical protein